MNKGLTLLEILLVVAMIAILGGLATVFTQRLQVSHDLDTAKDNFVHSLRRAQTLARTMEQDDSWGVKIQGPPESVIILFKGNDFGTRDSDFDETLNLPKTITASGTGEILFEKFSGEPKLESTTWQCGDNITFTYRGEEVTYGTIHNPVTNECWMDRNLGASQVATAYNDPAAYGDLFQWGRLDDSHQSRTSGTTETLSSTDDPGHSNFILNESSPYDWRDPQNDTLWQGVAGTNNPCPDQWRVATESEWEAERLSWSSNNYHGAFASPLKLTAGGIRSCIDGGSLLNVGSHGYYWHSTVDGTDSRCLYFHSSNAMWYALPRAHGFSVRCISEHEINSFLPIVTTLAAEQIARSYTITVNEKGMIEVTRNN